MGRPCSAFLALRIKDGREGLVPLAADRPAARPELRPFSAISVKDRPISAADGMPLAPSRYQRCVKLTIPMMP